MMNEFMKKIDELRELGNKILECEDDSIPVGQLDEVECMVEHLRISLMVLEKEGE